MMENPEKAAHSDLEFQTRLTGHGEWSREAVRMRGGVSEQREPALPRSKPWDVQGQEDVQGAGGC